MMTPEPLAKQIPLTEDSHTSILPEEQYRVGTWNLLATLLRQVPDQDVLNQVSAFAELEGAGPELQVALSMLGLAASTSHANAVDDEFHDLFIGMGRGELLPYGSWYQTGFLMERPLSLLRDDLAALGYQREESTREPEDHVAALCEVMALLIQDGHSLDTQARFFQQHMEGWLEQFFDDLSNAESAVFFRSVGRLGKAFAAFEKTNLTMQ